MTLTPFEQLEFFVPAPRQAFNQIVETLLRGQFGAGAVQSFSEKGRIQVLEPWPGSPSKRLTFYQANYFVRGRWESYQRRQVREALQRALCANPAVRRWVLCVPTRLAAEDLRWFDAWRKQQAITVEALDGHELLTLLKGPSGQAARQQMRAWGVAIPVTEASQVGGRLRVSPADPNSGLTRYLYASVYNGGGGPAKGLWVELAHSVTRCVSLRHDERQWHDGGQAQLNPRLLRADRPLLPKEDRLITVIPIGLQTPLPVGLRLRFWTQETAALAQHLSLNARVLAQASQFDFIAGPGPELPPASSPNDSAAVAA